MKTVKSEFCLTHVMVLLACLSLYLPSQSSHADIVFSSRPLGPSANLYQINDQGTLSKLTNDTTWRDVHGSFSSKQELLFLSNRRDNKKITLNKQAEVFNLFIQTKPSAHLFAITQNDNKKRLPAFSPDSKYITYIQNKENKDELILINRRTNQSVSILTMDVIFDYSWAQDNDRIAVATQHGKQSQLSVLSLTKDRTETLVHSTLPEQIVSTSWSHDGHQIAFIATKTQPSLRDLSVFDVTANQITRISKPGQQVQSPVSWSKDSQHLLYSALVDFQFKWNEKTQQKQYQGAMHIFLSDIYGKSQQLTQGQHLYNRPVFSPDEKRIAYLYSESLSDTDATLKTMDTSGKFQRTLYAPVHGNTSLQWY